MVASDDPTESSTPRKFSCAYAHLTPSATSVSSINALMRMDERQTVDMVSSDGEVCGPGMDSARCIVQRDWGRRGGKRRYFNDARRRRNHSTTVRLQYKYRKPLSVGFDWQQRLRPFMSIRGMGGAFMDFECFKGASSGKTPPIESPPESSTPSADPEQRMWCVGGESNCLHTCTAPERSVFVSCIRKAVAWARNANQPVYVLCTEYSSFPCSHGSPS
jgi:hypothetical protein